MDQTLGYSTDEKLIWGSSKVGGKVAQVSSQSRVVSSGSNQAQSEDGALGHLLVGIICKLVEQVDCLHLGVRDSQQTQG